MNPGQALGSSTGVLLTTGFCFKLVQNPLPNLVLVQNLAVSNVEGVHHFACQGPTFPQGNFQFPWVGQNEVELLVWPHRESGAGLEDGFEQVSLGIDTFPGTADNFKKENVLLVPHGGEVGDGQVKRFVYQLAVLLREAANRRLELRESVRGP